MIVTTSQQLAQLSGAGKVIITEATDAATGRKGFMFELVRGDDAMRRWSKDFCQGALKLWTLARSCGAV